MTQLNAQIEFKSSANLSTLSSKEAHTLIVGITTVDKKLSLAKAAARLASEFDPLLSALASLHFKADHGQAKPFPFHRFEQKKLPNYQNLLALGIGGRGDFHAQKLLQLGGVLANQIRSQKLEHLDLLLESFFVPAASSRASDAPKDFAQRPLRNPPPTLDQTCELIALGIYLGLYTFDRYKKPAETPTVPKIRILSQTLSAAAGNRACQRAQHLALAVSTCRDLQTTPSNDMTPALLAKAAQDLAKKAAGIRVEIFDEKKLKTEKFGGILCVGHGSSNPPRLIIMDYNPSQKQSTQPIVLVGKGVTFDTGGTSLKPASGMEAMKMDMSGAAAVIAAVYGASLLKIKQRVIGLVPAAENRISDRSTNPGDIYTAYNGKTVEVLNTDAEGRLILADALSYAAKYKPSAVIDVATLTGACVIALGAPASGLMGNDGSLIQQFATASERIGERTWELPLYRDYADDLKSAIADYRNIGSNREGGASKAGCFLNLFVDGQYPWIHLDVASTADTPRGQGAHCPENVGTGVPVRGLIEFCESFKNLKK